VMIASLPTQTTTRKRAATYASEPIYRPQPLPRPVSRPMPRYAGQYAPTRIYPPIDTSPEPPPVYASEPVYRPQPMYEPPPPAPVYVQRPMYEQPTVVGAAYASDRVPPYYYRGYYPAGRHGYYERRRYWRD
jgi:hypothetical protein